MMYEVMMSGRRSRYIEADGFDVSDGNIIFWRTENSTGNMFKRLTATRKNVAIINRLEYAAVIPADVVGTDAMLRELLKEAE